MATAVGVIVFALKQQYFDRSNILKKIGHCYHVMHLLDNVLMEKINKYRFNSNQYSINIIIVIIIALLLVCYCT